MAGPRPPIVAGLSGTQRRQTLRRAPAGRRRTHGRGLRRVVQKPRRRGLSARAPDEGGLLRLRGGLPRHPPDDARRDARRPARGAPRSGRPRLRRHRAAGRKAAGRRGRAGVDRPAVAARHAAIRELRRAGRADSHRRDRPLRRAVRRVALRNLPQLHRQLPHGSRRPGQDHQHGPLHLVPHHRAGTARSNGPSRLDLRLRRVPEPLPLEPPRPAAPQRGVRCRVRPAGDGRRDVARHG